MDSTVNSSHHQAVDHIAQLFTVSARSADGTIEAFEWGDATLGGKPFLLGVQWHPERMAFDMPMSGSIAQHFVHEADAFRSLIRPR
jgi:putative glutamine amidotransferase